MLRAGREPNRLAGLDDRIQPVLGQAERLPFDDGAFDAVSFTYLLRYVDDPGGDRAGARARAPRRVARSRCSSSTCRRRRSPARGGGSHTRAVMPVLGTAASPAWARTAAFLGPNISRFVARHPLEEWVRWFQSRGDRARPHPHVPVRLRGRALGCEGRMSEERPAFYALAPGGWRDWWTLLHPPYTMWHLSYVALGAATVGGGGSLSPRDEPPGVLPGRRSRRARAGRASGAAAGDLDPGPGAPGSRDRLARRRRGRGGRRDRAGLGVARGVHRRRRVPRRRVQPRAAGRQPSIRTCGSRSRGEGSPR